ncbi:PAQR family membrane homeostasis protein TrhA [Nubsella zeaxanthinifaciens]|uniref:PAQR family membrane homeostasis protein TrhA n=1 Tax=Nubsella zeaxanthinifaciens TaxID=392412 RepID=UPI000DE31853|nr:hemolysin III family protein [Nubsella zeaxanthinifaciens]
MQKYIREPGNFITHFLPAVLALPGMYLLLQKSSTLFEETAAIVYGLGIFVLFSVSAIYHSVPKTEYGIRFWQKFDHCCIYLMIAGSFTPTALLIFDGWVRWLLFGLVWLIAILGCLLKIFNRLKKGNLSTGLYIAMGCLIIPFMAKMVEQIPVIGLFWLLLGGVFYIGGTYYYAKDKPLYKYLHSHELWHVFVNLGALSHFIYNYSYVFKG